MKYLFIYSLYLKLNVIKYCLPFFLGPLHTTASSFEVKRKPMDITASFWEGSGYTGTHLGRSEGEEGMGQC